MTDPITVNRALYEACCAMCTWDGPILRHVDACRALWALADACAASSATRKASDDRA